MSNVVVRGGGGFIGGHLVRYLRDRSSEIVTINQLVDIVEAIAGVRPTAP